MTVQAVPRAGRQAGARGLALLLLVAVPLTGCGDLDRDGRVSGALSGVGAGAGSGAGAPTATGRPGGGPDVGGAAATTSAAVELRAVLTGLLCEHAYLLGDAVAATVTAGDVVAPAARAAVATQDAAAVALADALGAGYPDARTSFLAVWRARSEAALALAVTTGGRDPAGEAAARAALAASPRQVAEVLAAAVPALPAENVTAALTPATARLVAAVEATVSGRDDALPLLRDVAGPGSVLATVLAQTIAQGRGLEGQAGSAAGTLRASLTHLLVEHVHLVAAASARPGPGATAALDANARAIAASVDRAAPGGTPGLRTAWRQRTSALLAYPSGGAAGRRSLDDGRAAVGRALAGTGALTGGGVSAALEPATATLAAALDARSVEAGSRAAQVREAGRHAATTAAFLSSGLLAAPRD